MSSISPSEASSSLSAQAKRTPPLKSDVQIHLGNHFRAKVYTSSSPLSGEVTITTQRAVPFDTVEIILLGCTKTRTNGYNAPHESTHTFLKMRMPVEESSYPVPRVLEAGTTLTIPFNFVLPNFLTLNACKHKVASDHVRDKHLCAPPSMGSWTRINSEKDDLSPNMAEVQYCIKARVWRSPEVQEQSVNIMEATKPIQVLPAFAEDAPLNITKNDRLYRLCGSKMMRKNLISTKLGQLTVSAQQPRAIMLEPDGNVAVGTTAKLDLQFEPVSGDIKPPKITGVSSKLTAHTYYSAGFINSIADTGEFTEGGVLDRRGIYSKSVSLDTDPPGNTTWVPCRARRDSGYCSDNACENTASEDDEFEAEQRPQQHQGQKSGTIVSLVRPLRQRSPTRRPRTSPFYYSTSLQLPVRLPSAKKYYVPTFHSCIASRVYTLHVTLTMASGPRSSSTISLNLPVQIAVGSEGPDAGGWGLPSFEDAMEDAAVDELLGSRLSGIASVASQDRSAPPGYRPR
ncbi:hypothetical protein VPNG_01753 [Cytospora leucostoma]|uniref:Arrestin-like N-terminal domain-containing protein n=1 Tax=Cytospora leucostoma TaxID=1230097 RepID=A0A423XKP2_9PEZI|nr:hypothetical protein VPNG_01753 [Cytospora leucostoma]